MRKDSQSAGAASISAVVSALLHRPFIAACIHPSIPACLPGDKAFTVSIASRRSRSPRSPSAHLVSAAIYRQPCSAITCYPSLLAPVQALPTSPPSTPSSQPDLSLYPLSVPDCITTSRQEAALVSHPFVASVAFLTTIHTIHHRRASGVHAAAAAAAAKDGPVAHVRRHPPGPQQGRRTESARGCPPVLCQLGESRPAASVLCSCAARGAR